MIVAITLLIVVYCVEGEVLLVTILINMIGHICLVIVIYYVILATTYDYLHYITYDTQQEGENIDRYTRNILLFVVRVVNASFQFVCGGNPADLFYTTRWDKQP